ncbi:hypothetical protein B0H17DRAFT_1210849 [Mycena rosella]|uniref:Protein kinase domain-containing protein n=1 Tax=Mycena rosella TaxID=1033263 RepID=A0AAD7CZC8_MYCRO|nr:hypothetical protein B0H17DRAFT_1210849 [Mycena rosella]
MDRDYVGWAKHCTLAQAPPYYLIDFRISVRFEPGEPRMVYPIVGGDQSPPEFEGDGVSELLDSFPTDVYYLGNFIREEFMEGPVGVRRALSLDMGREGFDFMRPLVDDMTQADPKTRPTMDEVVLRFASKTS